MWLLAILDEARFRSSRSEVTLHNYEVALRRWAALGVHDLHDVTVAAAQKFVESRLAHGNKVQTVATDYMALLAVLSHLEETGRYKAAALAEIRRAAPRARKNRQLSADFLTAEELERYCAAVDAEAAFLVRVACLTGLRAAELAYLEWSDVDLRRRMVHVRRGKTGARRVPLCAPAIDLLRPRLDAGATGRVFGGVGTRMLQDAVRAGRELSGVRVTLTLCRHTRASWWVQAGVPLAKVAKWLGHSVAVCARHYAGLEDAYDPAVERGAAG
jgi:integrase